MRPAGRITTALIAAQCLAAVSALAAAPDCVGSSQTPWPTKDWEASTPEAQGMDSAALAQLVDFVGIRRQDSLLVIRHGKIVVDAYYAPYAPNIRHDLRSVTKSFISTLTLAFDGNKVDINFESTDGAKAELHGEADQRRIFSVA
jgi:CubicO group peptidase (beta-lactamase class C family)